MKISAVTFTQDSDIENLKKEGEEKVIFSPSSYDQASQIDQEVLWKKIKENLEKILSSEFSSPLKREVKPHTDRLQFACVFCGDSFKDPRKKRGNIFSATMQYHCFNGDCHAHMSVFDFFEKKKSLDDFTLSEKEYMKTTGEARALDLKKLRAATSLETLFEDETLNMSVSREFFMKRMGLQEIKGSKIENYLRNRHQTDYNKFAWDSKGNQIYVFNLNKSEDRIIGLQIKTFNKKNPYITWKMSEIHQKLGIYKEENAEKLEKMNMLSKFFGIFQVDFGKPITIFEGPLDSFLFPNSIGLCSAKTSIPFEIEGCRYFYDNDKTGKEWAVKRLSEGNSVFLWRKFLEENSLSEHADKIKDLNDLIIFVNKNKVRCKPFLNYFSDDKYDAIYV